jgi:hypothetical protein
MPHLLSALLLAGLLAGAGAGAGAADAPGAPLSRGWQWVRRHPFTWNAMRDASVGVEPYQAVGFSSWLAGLQGDDPASAAARLGNASRAGLAWHFFGRQLDPAWYRQHVPDLLARYPGNIGWLIGDEVGDENGPAELQKAGQCLDALRELAPDALAYTACRGLDFKAFTPETYRAYLDAVLQCVRPDVLQYDHYPFYRGGTAGNFFLNLALVREKALAAGIPYWCWLQTHGWTAGPFQEPSESELRFQAFAALAYGFTGLSCWTFDSAYPPYSRSLLDANGQPTPIYHAAAAMTPEILHLGQALRFLRSTGVCYQPAWTHKDGQWQQPLPEGTVRWTPEIHPRLQGLTVSDGAHGWVLGFFRDDAGEDYIMVVNGNHAAGQGAAATAGAISMRWDDTVDQVERLNRSTGKVDVVDLHEHTLNHWVLPGGTGELFKYHTGKPFAGLNGN